MYLSLGQLAAQLKLIQFRIRLLSTVVSKARPKKSTHSFNWKISGKIKQKPASHDRLLFQ